MWLNFLSVGIPPAIAVGTDLLFAAITKSFGAIAHWRVGNVGKRLLTVLIIASLTGAALASAVIHEVKPNIDAINRVIRFSLGLTLFGTAFALLMRPWLLRLRRSHPLQVSAHDVSNNLWPTVVLGLVIGAVVTLSSVGAGAIGVTALLLLHPALPISRIVCTDIAYAVPLTAAAGLAHASVGYLDVNLLIGLLVAALSFAGVKLVA